jgi:gamma-tubulin complex component 4
VRKLDQSTNFEEIRHSHDIFLTTIMAHTFINNKSVNHCLSELLKVCQQYCDFTNDINPTKSEEESNEDNFIENLALNFSRQSGLLFKFLSSIQNRTTGTQLAQLLLRIDYNRYFSKHGHDIGKIGL